MRHRNQLNILPSVCALGCTLFLSACGVRVTVESPYWYTKALDGRYLLTLKVEQGSSATIDAVEVTVNGQSSPMTGTGQARTFTVEQGGAKGLKVVYQVKYTAPGFFVPQQLVNRHPNVGELQIPILDPDSDIDADGVQDRDDNCPFHPNSDQQMGPTYTNTNNIVRLGAVCDAQAPGLRHITLRQTRGTSYVTKMRDNTGNLMLTEGGRSYYAFRTLVSSKGQVTELQVDGVPPDGKTVEIANCALVYQDGDGGRWGHFVQVYAAEGAHQCTFAIKSGDRTLVDGSELVIAVISRVDPAVAAVLRNARMFGRVTLHLPPQDGPQDALDLFHRLTENSPANYADFYMPKFDSLSEVGGPDRSTEADFGGDAYIVFRP